MGTLGILYLVFGILYLLACIADGQDVKPIWKRWLGGKLERYADRLKPIDYCNRFCCMYYQEANSRRNTVMMPRNSVRIEGHVLIGESEVFDAHIREERMRRNGRADLIPAIGGINELVERAKKSCVREILHEIEKNNLIDIRVNTESRFPEITVDGYVYVGQNENY